MNKKFKFVIITQLNSIHTISDNKNFNFAIGSFDSTSKKNLLKFINQFIVKDSINKECFLSNEFIGEVCTFKLIKKEGKKIIWIYDRLEYAYSGKYIESFFNPEDLKQLLEFLINEEEKFEKNPLAYEKKLMESGAMVISIEDFRNNEEYNKKAPKIFSEAKNSIIVTKNKKEAKLLKEYYYAKYPEKRKNWKDRILGKLF